MDRIKRAETGWIEVAGSFSDRLVELADAGSEAQVHRINVTVWDASSHGSSHLYETDPTKDESRVAGEKQPQGIGFALVDDELHKGRRVDVNQHASEPLLAAHPHEDGRNGLGVGQQLNGWWK